MSRRRHSAVALVVLMAAALADRRAAAARDAAIATRSTPPPVFTKRIHPAGLSKFGGNLTNGNFVLLKGVQPDPALPLRGGHDEVEWYINAADADADMAERARLFQHRQGRSGAEAAAGAVVRPLQARACGGCRRHVRRRPAFAGVDDFKQLIAADPRTLARAFTAHMIRYATGADISYADRLTIDGILDTTAPTQYGLRSILHAIAASPLITRP